MKKMLLVVVFGALLGASFAAQAGAPGRGIPRPLVSHPGNIFVAGEPVIIGAPPGEGGAWRAVDYEGKVVAQGPVKDGRAELGRLPVGYYEVARGVGRFAVGVLAGLRAPTPLSSPIGADVAMAWLVPREKMEGVASLCAVAGLNRVRDRLDWGEMEPRRGEFAGSNRYDFPVRVQAAAGLQVLQVSHRSPAWANPNNKRFPLDLRDAYDFHRALARRWRAAVAAFEPWNEADIEAFGGHTGSEMASFQKAAWLGLKAGNPQVTGCLNVFALHREATLQDLQENEAWPYFDTFNLHHYAPFADYPRLYADFRGVCAGRPLWVTECSLPVKWRGDERLQEPTPEDLREQSERVPITYALAIHEGAQAVFYFILPHYVEGQTQFGALRRDLTPRPAFLALAAAGRLLADARPLGRVQSADPAVRACLFEAKPDGRRAQVLVAWSEGERSLELPRRPRACFDHLGRARPLSGGALRLGRAPQFIILAPGTRLPLTPPPARPAVLPGKPSCVVLQAVLPETSVVLRESAYKLPAGQATDIPVFAYNLGAKPARGRLRVALPEQWQAQFPEQAEIAPGERSELRLRLTGAAGPPTAKVRITGDFGPAGRAVLSLRFQSQEKTGEAKSGK
ncbi:MAG: hypothetical protein ABSF95_22185 [Verrucomicrobiota bacterium]|jgi:hypothetical protein